MEKQRIAARLAMVRKSMGRNKLSWLVLTNPANVTYVTGFMGEDSWALVGSRKSYLLTDSRYSEEAKKQCACCEIVERTEGMVKETGGLVGARGMLGVDDAMTVVFYELLRKKFKGRVKRAGRIVEESRQVKDAQEAGLIEKAAAIALEALGRSLALKTGMTESELAGRIEFEMRKNLAKPSFETIVAFGANGSIPHHRPGGRRLRRDDTILIDFGVKWNGYCCDMTRCFAVGKVSSTYQKAYEVVLEAHRAAVRKVKAGVSVKELDEVARRIITDKVLPPYGHGLGHGLGLEIHEGPSVSLKSEGVLKAGQVITIEPGIYIPGKLGIRIEDDYLVTEKGCRLLSGGSKRFTAGPLAVLNVRQGHIAF
jgi:Xaa-Pro aminopeptidase